MQAHGAEMMRLAASLATERGVRLCAPIHDAFLMESDTDQFDAQLAVLQDAMAEASREVLDGFEVRTEAEIVTYPDRYVDDKDDTEMWDKIMRILDRVEGAAA